MKKSTKNEEYGNIKYLIEKCISIKEKNNEVEKMIVNNLNEKNIDFFFNSELSEERKIRILSKVSKLGTTKNISDIITNWVFNIQNNKDNNLKTHKKNEEDRNQELFMIIYPEEYIHAHIRRLNIKLFHILNPNFDKFKIKGMKEKLKREFDEKLEKSNMEKQE